MEQVQVHFWFDVLTPGAIFLVSNVVRVDYNTARNKQYVIIFIKEYETRVLLALVIHLVMIIVFRIK
jgi:hypothetical protein